MKDMSLWIFTKLEKIQSESQNEGSCTCSHLSHTLEAGTWLWYLHTLRGLRGGIIRYKTTIQQRYL